MKYSKSGGIAQGHIICQYHVGVPKPVFSLGLYRRK